VPFQLSRDIFRDAGIPRKPSIRNGIEIIENFAQQNAPRSYRRVKSRTANNGDGQRGIGT